MCATGAVSSTWYLKNCERCAVVFGNPSLQFALEWLLRRFIQVTLVRMESRKTSFIPHQVRPGDDVGNFLF